MAQNSKFTTLFVNYTASIKRYINKIAGPDDIDDIIQETFIRTYEADLKEEIKYARSFILKTAKNLALNHANKWDNKYSDSLDDSAVDLSGLTSLKFEDQFESNIYQATHDNYHSHLLCFLYTSG